ncbi:MAG TPA: M48 family metallopeptidase [Candidatus Binatia bacterium]|nr:M48 family metallopeptidase [Candidatus Binatia bacterium]
MAIVLLFIAFFLFVGLAIDYLYFDAFTPGGPPFPFATVLSLCIAAVVTLTAYYGGSEIILGSLGAEKLDIQIPEHREFHNVVTEMALASGSAMPKVYVIYDPAPNALATGTNKKNAAICVTTGLLILLNREETQGVVAHEISHIRNQDVLLMTLVSILIGGIAILADWVQRSFYSSRIGRRMGVKGLVIILPLLLLIVLSPLISRLLAMAVSRQREYLADATAVEYTRNPVGLAKALEKIRDAALPFNRVTRGTAHLFFVNPLLRRLDSREGVFADLLSTHPPMARRIMLLYRMAGLHPGVKGLRVETLKD